MDRTSTVILVSAEKLLQFYFHLKFLFPLHLFLHFRLMHFIAMFYSFVYVRVSFNGYNLEVSSHKIVTQIHSQVSFSFLLVVEKVFFYVDLNFVYLVLYCSFSFTVINIKNRKTVECNHINVVINSVIKVQRRSSCTFRFPYCNFICKRVKLF